ncbi:hypothetical protein OF83DRAFT_1159007 [Amylostereum chailletii]|nr:hypothetical protein OF83DRAFT_1159007 [Amylostereum chailletii]
MFDFLPARSSIMMLKSLTETDADKLVGKIVVIGSYANGVYHFRMSLVDVDANKSVRLDMFPSYMDLSDPALGTMIIERRQDAAYSDEHVTVPFQATLTQAASVRTILMLLFSDNARDKYRFNNEGQGCRHWCATLVGDLEQAGLLSSGAVHAFEQWEIEQEAALGTTAFPMPRIRGQFY